MNRGECYTDMANDGKTCGKFLKVVLWKYGAHNLICLLLESITAGIWNCFHVFTVTPIIVIEIQCVWDHIDLLGISQLLQRLAPC